MPNVKSSLTKTVGVCGVETNGQGSTLIIALDVAISKYGDL